MCALFGWLDYKHTISPKVLKKLTQALANAAEERGTDAAGISYVRDGRVVIFKRPKLAHKIRFNAPDDTTAIMGHTRLTTQGNQKFNQNNHPFYGHADKNFAFAHNGVLYNDEELRKEKNLPETHIETDSYVAVQLIEQQKKLDFDSLKNMAETVQGSFNFTILDEDNSLYIVKGSNPMFLIHFEEIGLYVYASTKSIMTNALKKVGMQNIPHTIIKTVHGDILKINSNGNISRSEFEEADNFFTPYTYRNCYDWWDYEDTEDDDYISDLLMVCGFYGVDSEDVKLLLEYGYTADEIEDMLFDINLFEETVSAIKLEM
ncbi:MAG: class II glutamine amidotransferase [Ruminococcus sp.]|nr:class II glutamine amidotransferase [Ruminococcus sp.]